MHVYAARGALSVRIHSMTLVVVRGVMRVADE